MSVDISAIESAAITANSLANLILVTLQKPIGIQPLGGIQFGVPVNNASQPAFFFNFYGEQTVRLRSDITDHFVEDNTSIQDQIALPPEIITGQGFVSEVNDIVPTSLKALQVAADTLYILGAYTPALTASATIALNQALQAYQIAAVAASTAVAAFNAASGNPTVQTKQQQAFQLFYGYWQQRELFKVETPYGVFTDMAIDEVRAVQDESTNTISTFDVVFKRMNFANTTLTTANIGQDLYNQDNPTQIGLGTSTPPATSLTPSSFPGLGN